MLKLLFFLGFTFCFLASVRQVNAGALVPHTPERVISSFFCLVISNQSVSCWGNNTFGQLGNGNNDDQNSPVLVKDLFNIVKVSVGVFHACAINSTGSIWCWGRNHYNQLGNGNNVNQNSPVLIESLHNIVDISVGLISSCAIDESGNGWLWGNTYLTEFPPLNPISDSLLKNVLEFSVGAEHICMLKKDGFVYCWGYNIYLQLGGNFDVYFSYNPIKVEGLSNIVEISSSSYDSCARNTTGSLFCWGLISRYVSQTSNITEITPIVEMSAPGHSIIEMSDSFDKHFLTKDGEVLALQIANYSYFIYPSLTLMSNYSNVVKIYSGYSILCAINTTGSVSCDGLPLLNQPLTAWVSKESPTTKPTTKPTTEPTTTSGKETMIIIIVSVVSGIIILIAGFLICRRFKSTILPYSRLNA